MRPWLVEHEVGFTERNVMGNLEAAQVLYQTGRFGTPLLVAGERKDFGCAALDQTNSTQE